jgi:hypothetical protein
MDATLKNGLSHRAVALGKLSAHLRANAAEVTASIQPPKTAKKQE